MEDIFYTVLRINGDYAILQTDDGIENTVAMAFLPIEICESDRVLYSGLTYTIIG